MIFALLPFMSLRAEEQGDTALFVKNAAKVIVSETPDALCVEVLDTTGSEPKTEVFTFPYEEGKKLNSSVFRTLPWKESNSGSQWDLCAGGLGIGFVNACGAPSGPGPEMGKSFEFTIKEALAVSYSLRNRRDRISAGIGMVWRNYKMTAENRFFITEEGNVGIGPYESALTSGSSQLKTFSLSFPITWHHKLSKNQSFNLSVMLNANTYGSLKTSYKAAGNTKTEEFTKISPLIRKFSVDFMGSVHLFPGFSLYVRYSPMKVLKNGCGPQFSPLSTGLLIWY